MPNATALAHHAPTSSPRSANGPWVWDIFCRVIDNHGDLGVCWRLARRLVALGHRVRLWTDDERALAWMTTPAERAALSALVVRLWRDPEPTDTVGDVVVEAFGCDPPEAFVCAMAQRAQAGAAPVWINLEYLSAEGYVERCHALPSRVQCGPATGWDKWFFYPGFTAATGGPLREPGLADRTQGWPGRRLAARHA